MKFSAKFFFTAAAVIAFATSADAVTYIASGIGADGAVNGQAVITTGSNSMTVVLTDLLANPTSDGQEISGIQIMLGTVPGSVSLSHSFGTLRDITQSCTKPHHGASVCTNSSSFPGGSINHWGVTSVGSDIYLATAGIGALKGKPYDLIILGGGVGGDDFSNANASIRGKNPQIDGVGTFSLRLTGDPNPAIDSVMIEFGTNPNGSSPATVVLANCTDCGGVPEPSAWTTMLLGFFGVGFVLRRSRNASTLAIA